MATPQMSKEKMQEAVNLEARFGTYYEAAKATGIAETTLKYRVGRARAAGIKHNLPKSEHSLPEADFPLPPGHYAKGVSTLIDGEGNIKLQWVKSQAYLDDLKKTAEEIVEGLTIKAKKPVPAPKQNVKDLLTCYPCGDPHIGLYAWSEECGDDFDCEIAERNLSSAIDRLVNAAQPTEEALIANLGDFFHADNQTGVTVRSGHKLDVDTRKQRVMVIGVRIMTHLIDTALTKHKHVTVINEVGNHDDESSFVLSLILEAHYKEEARVDIDLSPATFHFYRFHKVLIGITHGYQCKADKLGQIMAADRKEDWGETDFRYWLVGHIHHTSKKEVPGCIIESFRTLAAKDAWHSASGYRSGRDMVRITYHKDYGEVGREILGIKEIAALQKHETKK